MPSISDQTASVSKWLSLSMVIVFSLVSATVATWFVLWLGGAGSGRGIFRAALGNMQYVYFSIVIVTISLAAFIVSVRPRENIITICAPALGGYLGSLMAYCSLAFTSIERMIANHPEFVVAPFIMPTHLIFVAGGARAGVVMFGSLRAYRSWYQSHSRE